MERRGERRRKKVGKDGQIDRQTAERQARQPLRMPTPHPRPSWRLLGSHLQGWASESHLTTASGACASATSEGLPYSLTPYFRPTVCSRGRAKEGALHGACRTTREGSLWKSGVQVAEGR